MSEFLAVAKEIVQVVLADAPEEALDIPASVGDDEAIHAVQKRSGDAGFECDESTAREIVAETRIESAG